jgi:hypothetical protein
MRIDESQVIIGELVVPEEGLKNHLLKVLKNYSKAVWEIINYGLKNKIFHERYKLKQDLFEQLRDKYQLRPSILERCFTRANSFLIYYYYKGKQVFQKLRGNSQTITFNKKFFRFFIDNETNELKLNLCVNFEKRYTFVVKGVNHYERKKLLAFTNPFMILYYHPTKKKFMIHVYPIKYPKEVLAWIRLNRHLRREKYKSYVLLYKGEMCLAEENKKLMKSIITNFNLAVRNVLKELYEKRHTVNLYQLKKDYYYKVKKYGLGHLLIESCLKKAFNIYCKATRHLRKIDIRFDECQETYLAADRILSIFLPTTAYVMRDVYDKPGYKFLNVNIGLTRRKNFLLKTIYCNDEMLKISGKPGINNGEKLVISYKKDEDKFYVYIFNNHKVFHAPEPEEVLARESLSETKDSIAAAS